MDAANDVFISYSHIDEEEEWVGLLDEMLQKRVRQRLGEAIKIWRDPALTRNEDFEKTIKFELLKSRLLVSIVSSRYVKSDWCQRELVTFCETARQRGDLMVNDKSRVFKVVKLPPEPDDPPFPPSVAEHFQKTLGYEFYELDPTTRRHREFNSMFGADWKTKFCLRVDDLADDINKLLRVLRGRGAARAKGSREKTVYLAETGPDLQAVRDELRRELRERGYAVLPELALPTSLPALEAHVLADLAQCGCSVHLVGAQSPFTPAGGEQSVDQLEHGWAVARGSAQRVLRLNWMPRGLPKLEGRREGFAQALRDDTAAQWVEDTTEGFKVFLLDQLAARQPKTCTLYLAQTTSDLQRERSALRERLANRGFKLFPELELSHVAAHLETQVREALSACDASVHLIGRKYGLIPEDAQHSLVEIQAKLAGEWSRSQGRPRFFWLTDQPETDPRVQQWIARLREEAPRVKRLHLLTDPLERADEALVEVLSRKEETPPAASAPADVSGTVYLLYDRSDEEAAYAWAQVLHAKGFFIPLIDFELDEAARLLAQQEHFAECDGALVFWGKSSVSWLNSALSTLRKAAHGRAEQPMRARGVLIAPPAVTSPRPPLLPPEILSFRQEGEVQPALLDPFVQRLAKS